MGPTSHDVVATVRRALRVRRVGHIGTLDPFASGLLLLLTGKATRLARFVVGWTKRYSGTIRLGTATDTCDHTGAVVLTSEAWRDLSDDAIREAMSVFLGRQDQRPPVFSAKKVGGRRAHRVARRGEEIELAEREVEVHAFSLDQRQGADVRFRAHVSSGTYVRALARDLGERLGCGAHVTVLRRTAVGRFVVEDAVTPLAASDAVLHPARELVTDFFTVTVDAVARESVTHGRSIEASAPPSGPVAIVAEGDLVAVAEADGHFLKPKVVLG